MKSTTKILAGIFASIILFFAILIGVFGAQVNAHLFEGLQIEPSEVGQVDLGIVLGAGLRRDGSLTSIAQERVDYALEYHADQSLPFMFSGGDTPYGTEAGSMIAYANANGYDGPPHHEGSSHSTYENAFFSDMLLDDGKIDDERVLVITSPYHARRAFATFTQLMPEREVLIDFPDESTVLEDSLAGRFKGFRSLVREYLATWFYSLRYGIEI